MRLTTSDLRLSPSDLSAFLGCRHRTGLDSAVFAAGNMKRPEMELIRWRRPSASEARTTSARIVDSLREQGLASSRLIRKQATDFRVARTLEAMQDGAETSSSRPRSSGRGRGRLRGHPAAV